MKLWANPHKHRQEPSGGRRVCPFMGRIALLICGLLGGLLGPLAPTALGYQDESLTLAITGADGGALPNVNVDLMRNGKLRARLKTGADGRASVRVSQGRFTVSIHQTGYLPVKEVVDTRTSSRSVVEIKLVPVPHRQETVNLDASKEDITERTSSPGEQIKPQEANEHPLRPLTLTDALPLSAVHVCD